MPFFNTPAAASSCCVLGDKNRVSAHWSLLAVVCRFRRSNSVANKIAGMGTDAIGKAAIAYYMVREAVGRKLENMEENTPAVQEEKTE